MKRMRNRLAGILLVLAMVFTMMPAMAWADSSNTVTVNVADILENGNPIGELSEDCELEFAAGDELVFMVHAPAGTTRASVTNTAGVMSWDGETATNGSSTVDITKGNPYTVTDTVISDIVNHSDETYSADDTVAFYAFDDSYENYGIILVKVDGGLVDKGEETPEPDQPEAPTFTVKVNGVECTDITKTENAYEYNDLFAGLQTGDLYTVKIPALSCNVQLDFSDNVLAYNYENGTYLSGWTDKYTVGERSFICSADSNSNGIADAIQIQSPYVGNSSTLHYAITFVPEFSLYKSAYGDASMLGNNWNEDNPLVAEIGSTPEDLNSSFSYLAADTTILDGVNPEAFTATWYYSNKYDASGKGYSKATCTTSASDYTDNGKGSLIASGTATDNKDFTFSVSQNRYTDYGMEFMDFKAFPLTNINPGTYYYYVDLSYKYGDGEVVLSTADNQAVVKIQGKPFKSQIGTASKVYNGKNQLQTVTVTDKDGNRLTEDKDYTVSYKNNKYVGKASVTVTGTGLYEGSFTKTFKINPVKTSVTSLAGNKKALTVKWAKKTTQTTGYQVRYSKNSKFSSYGTKTITSNKTVSKKITGLKAKTRYYVKVRTYKTVNGTKYYSAWSAAKSVKTK